MHIRAWDGQRFGCVAQQLESLAALCLLDISERFERSLYGEQFDSNLDALLMLRLVQSALLALSLEVRKVDTGEDT